MAAVALQRELEAYVDAIDKYNQQARSYKTSASKYNTNVDAYNSSFVKDSSGGIARFHPTRSGFLGLDGAQGMGIKHSDVNANYVVVDLGNNMGVTLQYKDKATAKPSPFNMAQPTAPGAAPEGTAGQMKRLDAPSLADVERVGDKGLISSVFNY